MIQVRHRPPLYCEDEDGDRWGVVPIRYGILGRPSGYPFRVVAGRPVARHRLDLKSSTRNPGRAASRAADRARTTRGEAGPTFHRQRTRLNPRPRANGSVSVRRAFERCSAPSSPGPSGSMVRYPSYRKRDAVAEVGRVLATVKAAEGAAVKQVEAERLMLRSSPGARMKLDGSGRARLRRRSAPQGKVPGRGRPARQRFAIVTEPERGSV